ncbi:MAG: PIN domain-containing protein [Pseudonocardiaceae bacterium]|nr:PIN domain-containing protein [Pseudonocardiaceae bacterium]
MTTLYLVDSSVFQRLPHQPRVADALRAFATRGLFATCLPITLETGHSATNGAEHARVLELINARRRLPITAEVEQTAVALQSALWDGGLVRAAGANDLVIAATAIVHGAAVLHYDTDYEHIAKVSELNHIWVVPRGSAT